jgi:hypothetical protein
LLRELGLLPYFVDAAILMLCDAFEDGVLSGTVARSQHPDLRAVRGRLTAYAAQVGEEKTGRFDWVVAGAFGHNERERGRLLASRDLDLGRAERRELAERPASWTAARPSPRR